MDINLIEALADIVQKKELTGLEIVEGETKIRIEKAAAQPVIVQQTPTVSQKAETPKQSADAAVSEGVVDFNKLIEVRSPFVGVFYNAPSPEAEPYVKVGDKIKKGDVLCIIESMKLMNEIVAEENGEIVDICVENGQVVEFSQILFKIF